MSIKGISVIICCYNSVERLPQTIAHLAQQVFEEPFPWEIIVVDNASTDDTAQVAIDLLRGIGRPNLSFAVVREDKPGLSFARHAGVTHAKHEAILFCDDDNWLQENYLQTALRTMNANPSIGALGGQGYVVSDVPIPEWFKANETSYAVGKQGEQTGYVTPRGYVCGAGMVTSKAFFFEAYPANWPSLLTDRTGSQLTSGGDNEFCQRLILLGYQLYYNEDLVYGHYMPAGRLTQEYKNRLLKSFEFSSGIVYNYTEAIQLKYSGWLFKARQIVASLADIAVKKLTLRKASVRSFKVLYLTLGINYKMDGAMQVVKRFYNAKGGSAIPQR